MVAKRMARRSHLTIKVTIARCALYSSEPMRCPLCGLEVPPLTPHECSKDAEVPRFPVAQGTPCRCNACDRERAGQPTVFRSEMFCAGCGHGYLHTGDSPTSSCSKCGTVNQWLKTKPTFEGTPG